MTSSHLHRLLLRALALGMAAAGALHALMGVAAERLLDPHLPPLLETLPSLDNQNRFYGAMFAVTGAVLWQAAGDLERYRPLITTALVGFMLAGLVRLIGVAKLGWPAPMVLALLVIEVVLPPCLLLWGRRNRG